MYIKFKVEDIEIELGGFDHAFDVKPLVDATVNAVTDIFKTEKVKELHDVIERFAEDDNHETEYTVLSFRTIEDAQEILNGTRTGKITKKLCDAIKRLVKDDDYAINDTVSCDSYDYTKTSFRTLEDAQKILNDMRFGIKQNGYCSVANYNMLMGFKFDPEDFNYGWTNLDDVRVERKQFSPLSDRSYYLFPYKLTLPNPVKITKKQTEVYE